MGIKTNAVLDYLDGKDPKEVSRILEERERERAKQQGFNEAIDALDRGTITAKLNSIDPKDSKLREKWSQAHQRKLTDVFARQKAIEEQERLEKQQSILGRIAKLEVERAALFYDRNGNAGKIRIFNYSDF